MRLLLIACVTVLTALTFFSAIRTLPATVGAQVSAVPTADADVSDALVEAAQATFDEKAADLNQTIADLQAENLDQASNLEATLAEQNQLILGLEQTSERLNVIEAENAALASDNGVLVDQLASLNVELLDQQAVAGGVVTTVQALNDEINKGLAEVQVLQTTIVDLEREGVDLIARIAELESNAAETQATPDTQSAEMEALLEQNTTALAASEERIALLTEAATVQAQVTSDMTSEIEELEAQAATLTTEATELSDAVAKRDGVIAGLMSQKEAPTVSLVASCQERSDAVLAGTQIGFDAGSVKITEASFPVLEELANIATDCAQDNLTLEIEGHTDASGGAASNLLLSDGRAKAVLDFLEIRGVPVSAMRAVGFGGSEPIADNNTSDGQSRNQRIIFDWEQR
jgi:outer membrane protein OmpA-like peptidoglycan-associated protein